MYYRDNPTFAPLNPHTHPLQRPVSALWEGVTRYLPRYLPTRLTEAGIDAVESELDATALAASIERGLSDLRDFLLEAQRVTDTVIVVQFLERSELETEPKEGYFRIREVVEALDLPLVSAEHHFQAALTAGLAIYRDNIHITAVGQEVLANVLLNGLIESSSDDILSNL